MTAVGDLPSERDIARFEVEPWIDRLGGLACRVPGLWRRLGDFETACLGRTLDDVPVTAPIFVCGLARSGTTILLECLTAHGDSASHLYRDYPGVLAPVFWDRVARRLYPADAPPVERAHGDGIAVTPDSPEAIEEMIWMAFFGRAHDPDRDNRLAADDITPKFASFFRDHIRKLLWLRGGRRYVSKGNYNLARMNALLALFPDARFIVPLRDPAEHVASLMRQHALFSAAQARHPAALRYLQRVGHFEFGLDRRPLRLGDPGRIDEVCRLWRVGRDVEGWALYWAALHDHLADELMRDAALATATLILRFEQLCAEPQASLARMFAHAALPVDEPWIAACARAIRAPKPASFTARDRDTIRALTGPVLARFG